MRFVGELRWLIIASVLLIVAIIYKNVTENFRKVNKYSGFPSSADFAAHFTPHSVFVEASYMSNTRTISFRWY